METPRSGDDLHSYSANERRRRKKKLQLVSELEMNPEPLALHPEFLPQYTVYVLVQLMRSWPLT